MADEAERDTIMAVWGQWCGQLGPVLAKGCPVLALAGRPTSTRPS